MRDRHGRQAFVETVGVGDAMDRDAVDRLEAGKQLAEKLLFVLSDRRERSPQRRSPIERFVDAILDGLADAPDDLVDALTLQFDLALEQERGTP